LLDRGVIIANGTSTTLRSLSTTKRQSTSNAKDVEGDSTLQGVGQILSPDIYVSDIQLGLSVHMSQVHKENLSAVDNALPNRAGLDIEIFGMEGIPEDIVQQHTQRVLTNFHQAEAERRAATGNVVAGAAGAGNQAKKPKFESPGELKKRLAEHKAKMAAEQANGGSSGGGTPLGAGQVQPPAMSQSPNSFVSHFVQPRFCVYLLL
jgi:hypothetical protein